MMDVRILFEDTHLFVVEKPAGMPSQPERSTAMDMVSYLKDFLTVRDGITNPYVGVVHRLDRPVGGVMVYAKTQKAAAFLSDQLRSQGMEKRYLAVVCGRMPQPKGMLRDMLRKDPQGNLSRVVTGTDAAGRGAREAVLKYTVLEQVSWLQKDYTLLDIHLLTGRHHQIRVQLAHAGVPVAGDRKYGTAEDGAPFWTALGLYCRQLAFTHPMTDRRMTFTGRTDEGPFAIFDNCHV